VKVPKRKKKMIRYLLVSALLIASCSQEEHQSSAPIVEQRSFANRCEENQERKASEVSTTTFSPDGSKRDAFESVAMLTISNGATCSGVLIESDKILTSAHCVEDSSTVRKVEFRDSPGEQDEPIQIIKTVSHPRYREALRDGKSIRTNPDMANFDLALVYLSEPVLDRVPAVISEKTSVLYPGKLTSLVGFGDFGIGAGIKRFAQSHIGRVVNNEKYGSLKFDNLILLDSQTGSGACPGDSGGGIFINEEGVYKLIGIVHGINDVLYPLFPVSTCERCPNGIGLATMVQPNFPFNWE
jgi:hypothetical protein